MLILSQVTFRDVVGATNLRIHEAMSRNDASFHVSVWASTSAPGDVS